MKNILIYINDSLGELDWIAPFLKSKEAEKFNFYIFLNGPGKNYLEKKTILERYDLVKDNIQIINSMGQKDFYLFKLDEFLNRVLGRIKLYSFSAFKFFRKSFDLFRKSSAYLLASSEVKFDYIFRDYNLKDSTSLQRYLLDNKEAKIVIFPHAVGLQKEHLSCPREPLKIVKSDLWLENSNYSDIAQKSPTYKDVFYASGVPAFDVNYELKSLFKVESKKVLIITRDCGMTFGFDYEDAFKVFDKLLEELEELGFSVEVKHHPRDRKISEWRKIQNKYFNIRELDKSLMNIDSQYSACLTLFSTAPLFLLSRQIPIYEFSPYKKYEDYKRSFPMHYSDGDGNLTHDLLALKLYKRLNRVSDFKLFMDAESLKKLSKEQYERCKEIFPLGANLNITTKLLDLYNDK